MNQTRFMPLQTDLPSTDKFPDFQTPTQKEPDRFMFSKQSAWTRLWNNIFYSGIEKFDNNRFRSQIYFVNTFSFLGFLSMTVFGLLHIFSDGNLLLGSYEILGGLTLLANQMFLRLTKQPRLAKAVLLFTVLVFLWLMLLTGGTQHTGVYWYYTFPAATFFLVGSRRGVYWMAALCLGTIALGYMDYLGWVTIPYTFIEIRQLLVSLLVVTILIFLYERTREQIENELLYDEQSLQEFLDNMATFAVKVNRQGQILLANRIAKESMGMGDQIIGRYFWDGNWLKFDPLAHNRFKDALRIGLTGKAITYYENIKIVGSSIVAYSFGLAPIFQGHRVQYLVIEGRDVSQLINIKDSFSQAEKIARLGSWEWDIPENKLSWSEGLYQIFDLDRSEPVTRDKFFQLIHVEDRDTVKQNLNQSAKSLKNFIMDYRIVRPDGETRYFHDEARVIIGNAGVPLKMVGIGQDVTELHHLQHQLKSLTH